MVYYLIKKNADAKAIVKSKQIYSFLIENLTLEHIYIHYKSMADLQDFLRKLIGVCFKIKL